MYDLQRRTTLKNNEKKVDVWLNFNNSVENHLGIPLPKGTVRVFTNDKEGKLQFIGADSIDHTPKDETISLFIIRYKR